MNQFFEAKRDMILSIFHEQNTKYIFEYNKAKACLEFNQELTERHLSMFDNQLDKFNCLLKKLQNGEIVLVKLQEFIKIFQVINNYKYKDFIYDPRSNEEVFIDFCNDNQINYQLINSDIYELESVKSKLINQ